MRNRIGTIAEDRVRRLLLDWLLSKKIIVAPAVTREGLQTDERLSPVYELQDGIKMTFGSDPDIKFTRGNQLLAVIEIKGGIDPAGALERYGAATKSFQHARSVSARCRNFYLGVVYTPELQRRIAEDPLVERSFDVVDILQEAEKRKQFFDELFHHTLRLV